ncbi:hypothetical protein ACH5RR_024847 [Cinchona calisaya]|uniref:Uncharacterized protein n=1 Tax=Cinchona calisaya TaxID=153742 RepID=A0ABD2Z1B1_9GENT
MMKTENTEAGVLSKPKQFTPLKELKKLKAAQKAKAVKLQAQQFSNSSNVAKKKNFRREGLEDNVEDYVDSEIDLSEKLEGELKKLKAAQKAEAAKLQLSTPEILEKRGRKRTLKEGGFGSSTEDFVDSETALVAAALKVMVATVLWEEIANEKCGSFLENEEWHELQETVQSHPMPDLEGSLVQFLTLLCRRACMSLCRI